jgi:hypothetical protein
MSVGTRTSDDSILLTIWKGLGDPEVIEGDGVHAVYKNATWLTRTEALQLATRILRLLDDNSMSCYVSPDEPCDHVWASGAVDDPSNPEFLTQVCVRCGTNKVGK